MNKKLKYLLILCAALLAVFFCIGNFFFTRQQDDEEAWTVICIPKSVDTANDFWTALIEGVEMGADDFDVKVIISGEESESNVEGQKERILAAIEEEPDAMLVAPADYENSGELLEQIVDAGITLILIDCVVEEQIGDSVVATDNYEAGRELGAYAAGQIDEDTVIGLVCHVEGTSTAIEREAGIRAGLGSLEENIVGTVFGNSSYEESYRQTEALLSEHPEITCIIATNEYSAVGAARALVDLDLTGQIQLYGFDNSVEEVQYIEMGVIEAIAIQKPFNMGYLAMEQAVNVLSGKKADSEVNTGSKLITLDNLYEEENQRLLYTFSEQEE